jgi:hypothetical protein
MPIPTKTPIARKAFLSLVALIGGGFVLWAAWDFAEPRIAEHFPLFAWHHGSPLMQEIAVKELMKQIKPGMTYDEVLAILGPGSPGWPDYYKERKLAPEDCVGFNVRSWYNTGVAVCFRDGRVVSTYYYD